MTALATLPPLSAHILGIRIIVGKMCARSAGSPAQAFVMGNLAFFITGIALRALEASSYSFLMIVGLLAFTLAAATGRLPQRIQSPAQENLHLIASVNELAIYFFLGVSALNFFFKKTEEAPVLEPYVFTRDFVD